MSRMCSGSCPTDCLRERYTMKAALEKEFLTELEIKSLLIRERYYRDTSQWEKLRKCYHPDSIKTNIKISWYVALLPEYFFDVPRQFIRATEVACSREKNRFDGDIDGFVLGSKRMARSGTAAAHVISPVLVHRNGDKAVSESTGNIQIRFELGGVSYDCISWTRFISRLERVSGEWKLLSLEAIYERDTITPSVPSTEMQVNLGIKGGRASYRCISWLLSQKGFEIDQTLPGTDIPASEAALMKTTLGWLHEP